MAARRSACRSIKRPARLGVVVGQHHDVFHDLFGQADGIRHPRRLVRIAPALRRRAEADLDRIVAAVIGAFALRDHRPAGVRACGLDRDEHRLAPGVAEAHRLHRLDPFGDDLGELDLALGGHRETASATDLLDGRPDDLGMGVPVDEGHVVVEAVDPLHPVRVRDPAPASGHRVDRIRGEERREPGASAGEHPARAPVERGGAGILIGVGRGHGHEGISSAGFGRSASDRTIDHTGGKRNGAGREPGRSPSFRLRVAAGSRPLFPSGGQGSSNHNGSQGSRRRARRMADEVVICSWVPTRMPARPPTASRR